MYFMFRDCVTLGNRGGVELTEALDWDTALVTDMQYMVTLVFPSNSQDDGSAWLLLFFVSGTCVFSALLVA
jgi:hypothetical protein